MFDRTVPKTFRGIGLKTFSGPSGKDATEEESEAQHTFAMRTGIHNFLFDLSDHLLLHRSGIGGGSGFLTQHDRFLAVRAFGHSWDSIHGFVVYQTMNIRQLTGHSVAKIPPIQAPTIGGRGAMSD